MHNVEKWPNILQKSFCHRKLFKVSLCHFLTLYMIRLNGSIGISRRTERCLLIYWINWFYLSPLSPNPTKWSNTLKPFVATADELFVFYHFVGLEVKGLWPLLFLISTNDLPHLLEVSDPTCMLTILVFVIKNRKTF